MKLFGTDGIRGEFGKPPINHNELLKIGYAFAKSLFDNKVGKILISNDGRESSSAIEEALSLGIKHQGSEVFFIGLYPTPALSIYLNSTAQSSEMRAGIQITASHNPYYDNGVKFFDNNGYKINSNIEETIERHYFSHNENIKEQYDRSSKADHSDLFEKHYIEYIDDYFRLKMDNVDHPRDKFNILVDCANGATSKIISKILNNSFVNLIPIFNEPKGKNINEKCGATDTNMLKSFISEFNDINANSSDYKKKLGSKILKIDLGVAFDGDGDRAIFISPSGEEINGDEVLYILATFHKKNNNVDSVVGTQMTNFGIQSLYKKNNINFIETQVGDKYVLKEMIKSGSSFGGESSGHILVPVFDNFYIGDGIITLINLLEAIFKQEKTINSLKKEITSIPSKLFNIKVINKEKFIKDTQNIKVTKDLKKMLNEEGRILLRPSGTENLVRLLIEHRNPKQIEILSEYFYDNINKNTIV